MSYQNKQLGPDFGDELDFAPPRPAAMIESLRAFGYELHTAVADLVDNSLFANSENVWIDFDWDGEGSAIAVTDDGRGMDEVGLWNAMRPGSSNPRDPRDPRDLGRFGLGLKTASFSQSRRLTVCSKTIETPPATRVWDLDHVARVDNWQLLCSMSDQATRLGGRLESLRHGTVVVWEGLDRVAGGMRADIDKDQSAFYAKADLVREYLAMVFHRLLSLPGRPFRIHVNGNQLKPWDPYLASEDATLVQPEERILLGNDVIEVAPFVLPHLSKISNDVHRKAGGMKGWNLQQGFYVYRNLRLLVAGDWLGVGGWKPEEHYKLARIRVDLPNSMDHEWHIDVTKSRARPPRQLRSELERIGGAVRKVAKHIYSHRGAKITSTSDADQLFLWEPRVRQGKHFFRINRDHPLVVAALGSAVDRQMLLSLLRLIEETVPVPLITITDRENPDQTLGPFEGTNEKGVEKVMRSVFDALRESGKSVEDALLRIRRMHPFNGFPEQIQLLAEEEGRAE